MCGRAGILLVAIFAATFLLDASRSAAGATSPTRSEIKSRFDLPAESLDKALRDLAVQANCNISYEPSIVAGLQAPPISGEFTVSRALSLLLKGTTLRAVNVNENTIQIVERPQSTSRDTASGSNGHSLNSTAPAGTDVPSPAAPSANADASSSTPPVDKSRDLEEIVVTGTHIRGVSIASPVIEMGREEIDRSGYTSIADVMLSLPQNFGGGYNAAAMVSNSLVNSRYTDNPTGASVPNLRGLGPGSTLTLIDGHRMASGLTGGGADIASIPLNAIERIEVVTDSASAIYGSDAVAGVVNVILKRNYQGAETSLAYGWAPAGGGTQKLASQLFGTRWDGGDVLIAYEHAQQQEIDARERDFTSTVLEPDSLLPQTKSNSVILSAAQDLSTTIAGFVDGLYIARDADHFTSSPYYPAASESPSTLRKYAVAAGLNFNLMRDWKATLFANVAEDATDTDSIFLTAPSTTPAGAERLLGTMRSIEVSANGGIATLPSGIVRLAVGAGYRREGFSDAAGPTIASNSQAEGARNIRYAFGELSIPLVPHFQRLGLNSVDLIVSARNERYSDFGAKTVPKIGLVYAPTSSITLRSTWGKAFRAPNLYDTDGIQQLALLDLPNPASSTGSSTVLVRVGGNPNLKPETAESWSIGADYSPADSGLQVSTTFFDIKYTNRISSDTNPYAAVTDPLNAFFITLSPSPSLAQSVYDSYPPSHVFNETQTGAPFDASKIGAILDDRQVNVASQTARGADLNVDYKVAAGSNSGLLFLNGTYLDLTQRDIPQAPQQSLSGLVFYPSKFRMRGGATWKRNAWALTGTINYLPRETNNQVTPFQTVGSWTTVDASLRYAPGLSGVLSGVQFSLSVLNAFDRDPPFVLLPSIAQQGISYDSSNTSPVGRFLSLRISKQW
jgi:iron complex outermembrane recepter protein